MADFPIEKRIFVAGTPTKGKINEAIRQQIAQSAGFEYDAMQFMNEQTWEAAERDLTPGFWITIRARQVKTMLVAGSDQVAVRDLTQF